MPEQTARRPDGHAPERRRHFATNHRHSKRWRSIPGYSTRQGIQGRSSGAFRIVVIDVGKRHRQKTKKAGSDAFRMVIASSPPDEVSIGPELDLIKAALLYGDEVTLLSPVTTMFLGVEQWGRFSMVEQLGLIRKVAPYMKEHNFAVVDEGADKIEAILREGGRHNRLLRAQLMTKFKPTQESTARELEALSQRAGLNQLAGARAKGLLKIESVDPGTTVDLIASCVISAQLTQEGKPNDQVHADQMVNSFIGKLSEHLSSGREYLIFDEKIASLTRAAIGVGLFKPAKGPAGRCAQAMTASGLMARLPTFPDATVDEILDIRSELSPALTQFRGAMVTLSKEFEQPAWDKGFEDEVQDAWVESVHPAVEAIDESVRSNKSLLTVASDATGAMKGSAPGLAILGAGMMGHDSLAAAAGGAVSATGALLQAMRARTNTARQIRMQPFYFVYALNQALPSRRGT